MEKLAQELGLTVEQLREFLFNGSCSQIITQYANSLAIRYICIGVFILAVVMVMIAYTCKQFRAGYYDLDDQVDFAWALMLIAIPGAFAVFLLSAGVSLLLYPQSTVLRLILNAI